MKMAGFISGNLEEMRASATKMEATATSATESGVKTHTATVELKADIEGAMTRVLNSFTAIGDDINGFVVDTQTQLVQAGWDGASREAATRLGADLQKQVSDLVGLTSDALTAEQTAFLGRADAVLAEIGDKFKALMDHAHTQYADLGNAVNTTAANFEEADRTISVG